VVVVVRVDGGALETNANVVVPNVVGGRGDDGDAIGRGGRGRGRGGGRNGGSGGRGGRDRSIQPPQDDPPDMIPEPEVVDENLARRMAIARAFALGLPRPTFDRAL